MTSRDPLDELLRAVEADTPLSEGALQALSGLDGEALGRFRGAWSQVGEADRAEILEGLRDVAQENLALDFGAVCEVALADPAPAVRIRALDLAAEDGSLRLFEPCLRAASDDPDRGARMAAVDALGVFTLEVQASDWPLELRDRAERVLLAHLRAPSADADLRQVALLSVAYLTTPEVQTEIRRAYADPSLHQAAIQAMGRNCQDIWIPDLEAELRSDHEDYRLQAVLACAELEDERLVPSLVDRLHDSSAEVRLAAIEALGLIGGEEAQDALLALERSPDARERAAARAALAEARARDDFTTD